MPRLLSYALALTLLVLATAACGAFSRAPRQGLDTAQTLLRCGAEGGTGGDHEAASRALIAAARHDPGLLASQDLIVAYRAQRRGPLGLLAGPRRSAAVVRAAHGLTLRRPLAPGHELVAAARPLDAAERLLDDPDVLYAHPDLRLVTHAAEPEGAFDLDGERQWNLTRFGVPQAWAIERGSADVVIAVIDAGMDTTHPEFAGRVLPGWDFYGADGTTAGDDDVTTRAEHGTHVAGIAVATGDDGFGVSGVATAGVRVLPVKVFDDGGGTASIAAVAEAIRWAAGLDVRAGHRAEPAPLATPARVINLSLGSDGSYLPIPELDEAIRDARRKGAVVVASVGNDYGTAGVTSPGNSPCAVGVTSVDESLERSAFANYDAASHLVDVAAPGGASSSGQGVYSTMSDARYGYLQGTSMAAPHVSAAIALLWSAHPEWSDAQVLERLLQTALLPQDADPAELGFGVVCADAALGASTRCGR